MSTTLFGQKIDWPFFCSPTALQRLFNYEGERATARAAHASGTIFSLSSISSSNIEDTAKFSDGPKVFQVYMFKDRSLSREFVQRAKDSGYVALLLTVDVTVSGNRERDIVTGMTVPPRSGLMSLLDIAMKPRWVYRHLTTPKIEVANVAHRPPPGSEKLGGIIQYLNDQIDRSVTWKDAEWMINEWGGPFAIKGIMTGEDAKRAADIGATAVMVSNHGGRQLDFSPAPIDVLKEVVDAAGDRLEVILDGGVRRGTHVLKALALGARACSAGRPHLYGLGAGGEAGVTQALKILKTEIARDMALLGVAKLADERHVARELGLQDIERLRNAGFAARAQAVQMRAPGGASARAERERLQHMRAAAYAAVENDLEAIAGRVDDLLEHVERRRREVELPAAVVRDHHGRRADVGRALRVRAGHDAFDRERAAPLLDHPLGVLPRDAAVDLIVQVLNDAAEVLAAGRRTMGDVGDLDLRRREMPVHPLRLHRDVEQAHEPKARRHRHARGDVALAITRYGDVDRELQRNVTAAFARCTNSRLKLRSLNM